MTDTTTNPAQEQPEKEGNFFSENKKLIVTGIVIIIMLLFIFMNLDPVKFWILFEVEMPMVVVILMFFSIGAITAWVYAYFNKKELKRKLKAAEKRLKQLGESL